MVLYSIVNLFYNLQLRVRAERVEDEEEGNGEMSVVWSILCINNAQVHLCCYQYSSQFAIAMALLIAYPSLHCGKSGTTIACSTIVVTQKSTHGQSTLHTVTHQRGPHLFTRVFQQSKHSQAGSHTVSKYIMTWTPSLVPKLLSCMLLLQYCFHTVRNTSQGGTVRELGVSGPTFQVLFMLAEGVNLW